MGVELEEGDEAAAALSVVEGGCGREEMRAAISVRFAVIACQFLVARALVGVGVACESAHW